MAALEETMKSARPTAGDIADPSGRTGEIDLFISYSSRDESLAEKLTFLIEAALKIRHDRVRSSADSRKRPGGAPVATTLRSEIKGCRAFVAIMTAASDTSAVVVAEIGARWMAGGHAVILRAGVAPPTNANGPLADTGSLDLTITGDLHQLIGELAGVLQLEPAPHRAYSRQLAAVVAASIEVDAKATTLQPWLHWLR